jgi:hypothetical protein
LGRSKKRVHLRKAILITFLQALIFSVSQGHAFDQSLGQSEGTSNLKSPANIPNFEMLQSYRLGPPLGIGSVEALGLSADGAGVTVALLDGGIAPHINIPTPAFSWSSGIQDFNFVQHGVASAGIIFGKSDGFGIIGIAPRATFGFAQVVCPLVEPHCPPLTNVISRVLTRLSAGDVMVIDVAKGDLPIDSDPQIFSALREVSDRGVYCVIPTGNSGVNLDDPRLAKIVRSGAHDSGCILVGSHMGVPNQDQAGTIFFEINPHSGFGRPVDVFAHSSRIVTTGYGDLLNTGDPSESYTQVYGETSAAAPIVAGLIASVVSKLKSEGCIPSPEALRDALRKSGAVVKNQSGLPQGKSPNFHDLYRDLASVCGLSFKTSAHEIQPAGIGKISLRLADGSGGVEGGTAAGIILDAQKGLFLTALHNIFICLKHLGAQDDEIGEGEFNNKICGPDILSVTFQTSHGPCQVRGAEILRHGHFPLKKGSGGFEDWAVLHLDSKCLEELDAPQIAKGEAANGEPASIFGFPITPVGVLINSEFQLYRSQGRFEDSAAAQSVWISIYQKLLATKQLSFLFAIAKERYFDAHASIAFHSAPIQSGYSGGPVFNDSGDLMGIISGSAGIWNSDDGPLPKEVQFDPYDPSKPSNSLGTYVRIQSVIDSLSSGER